MLESVFLFFLDTSFGYAQDETKKIKAANKKAEIYNITLKSRNSPEEFNDLKFMLAQSAAADENF